MQVTSLAHVNGPELPYDIQDNILISEFGEPMITDFGLSRMLSYSQTIMASTEHGSVNGTIRWMAFELFGLDNDHVEHTKASDMWAYGMIIYVSDFYLVGSLCSLKTIGLP